MLISLILLSLIKGIVWEVFTAVQENSLKKKFEKLEGGSPDKNISK